MLWGRGIVLKNKFLPYFLFKFFIILGLYINLGYKKGKVVLILSPIVRNYGTIKLYHFFRLIKYSI